MAVGTIIPLAVDDTEKSLAIAVVAPVLSDTEITHVIVSPTRSGILGVHAYVVDVVGFPNTSVDTSPLLITAPSVELLTKNAVVAVGGMAENVNVNPPSAELSGMSDETDDVAKKSEGTPVVAPLASLTEIVQTMGLNARCGVTVTHDRLELFVGLPYTTNDGVPMAIVKPLPVI